MKIAFNCYTPFMLTHGGLQTQIEQTRSALEQLGVEVEPLRWWDDAQRADILHHFNRPPISLVRAARQKGWPLVAGALESGGGARPPWARFLIKLGRRSLGKVGPGAIADAFAWNSYKLADACIAMSPWEAHNLVEMFQVDPARLHTIPNGVEQVFLESQPATRGPWLVCTASIIEMKQVLKLAQMAVQAEVPVWIIGKPHSDKDDYAQRFVAFARDNSRFVRYEGGITDRKKLAAVYRQARGFVLLSRWEGLSLSALEAAACECPLLLSKLPWATWTFKDKATYCPISGSASQARLLRDFYDHAPQLPVPSRPLSWMDVGRELKRVYEALLSTS